MRRVGGYNLDIFCNQSERPYTTDGSVNLAHLLIGSEGTLALTRSLQLQLAPLPAGRVLGVVNFPTFYKAMDSAQHIVRLGDAAGVLTAVELVDRTMIELALRNPAFEPTVRASLIGRPDALLLVEFAGGDRTALVHKLRQLEELMGELGLLGMGALAAVVLTYWLTTRRIQRAYRDHPGWERDFLYHLSRCLEMVLMLLLLNGTFGHNLYRYTWQWCGAFAIITLHCVRQRQAEEAESVGEEPEEAEEEQLNWGGAPA